MNTVGESIALGNLLRYFLRIPSRYGLPIPTGKEALVSALHLVVRAQKTGACCLSPEEVITNWPKGHEPTEKETK